MSQSDPSSKKSELSTKAHHPAPVGVDGYEIHIFVILRRLAVLTQNEFEARFK